MIKSIIRAYKSLYICRVTFLLQITGVLGQFLHNPSVGFVVITWSDDGMKISLLQDNALSTSLN